MNSPQLGSAWSAAARGHARPRRTLCLAHSSLSSSRPGIALIDRLNRLPEHPRRMLKRLHLLGPQRDLQVLDHSRSAHYCGYRQAYVTHPIRAVHQRRHRQDPPRIERDRVHHLPDRQPHGKARARLELDHLGARAFGPLENGFGLGRAKAREPVQRQPRRLSCRPHRHHAVAMLAQNQRRHLGGRQTQPLSDQTAKASRVEHRAQADHLRRRQTQFLNSQIGEHVHGIGYHNHDRLALEPRGGGLLENRQKELDVAIDQVQPALIGLAPQSGRNHDDVARGDEFVTAGADPLVGRQRGAVEQVERLAGGELGVGVDQVDGRNDPAALEREGRRGPHQPTAADDTASHSFFPSNSLILSW